MARKQENTDHWINQHLRADAPRSRSLIVTMFGDAVAPYSDGVWLSDLIDLLRPFGVNERLVRTSVFRLAEDGWLTAKREGRRSYYTLAPGGRRRFQHAYDRVYTPQPDWDGTWTLIVLPKTVRVAKRAQLRRELEWEGFGVLAPGAFLRPAADSQALREVLDDLGLNQSTVVFQAREGDSKARKSVANLVMQCWDLKRVAAGYEQFLAHFDPVYALINSGASLSLERAFVVQTLLIDSFRRLTLHDPRLPAPLLPANWSGHAAYELCRKLYGSTFEQVREFVLPHLTPREGPPPRAPTEVLRRFGGLA